GATWRELLDHLDLGTVLDLLLHFLGGELHSTFARVDPALARLRLHVDEHLERRRSLRRCAGFDPILRILALESHREDELRHLLDQLLGARGPLSCPTELRERALDEHMRAFREREVEPVALRLRPEPIARAFAPIADEAHLLFEPANGVLLCELEPVLLRLLRRDGCDRADLGPGELAAGEGLVDGRGLVEVARDRDQPLRLLLGNAELDLCPMSRASKAGTEKRAALHVFEVERERAAVNVSVAEMVEAASDELISRKPQDDFDLLFHVESPLLDSLPSRPRGLSDPRP